MGSSADFETVMGLVFAGKLSPIIDTVYPMEESLTALKRLKDGDVIGKLVINVR